MIESLRKKKDFDSVYKSGQRWHNPYFILFYKDFDTNKKRLGLSVSKKIGNATCRNLVKRRLRSIYRDTFKSIKNGDMIILAKNGIDGVAFKKLKKDYFYALKRLDILEKNV